MGIEKRINKWLISFIIGGSVYKLDDLDESLKKEPTKKEDNSISKITKFFHLGVKEMKKEAKKQIG